MFKFVAVICLSAASVGLAQQRPTRERRSPAEGRGHIGTWSMEEIDAWLDRLAETHLEIAKNDYDLTKEEAEKVQGRLAEQKKAAHEYWVKNREEYQSLDREMQKIVGTRDKEARDLHRAMMERRGVFMTQMPMHIRVARPQIEKVIPPEKVKAYYERQEAARRNHEEFFAAQHTRQPTRSDLSRFDPRMPWEWYVDLFIRAYKLDEKQQESARSVLRDLDGRRVSIMKSKRAESAPATATRPSVRLKVSKEIDEATKPLFSELKQRLDTIPTEAQRRAAEEKTPTSLPTSRPTTQPAKQERGNASAN